MELELSKRVSIGRRTKKVWSDTIHDKLVAGLGRCIRVNLKDLEIDCPNCYYDVVHKASTNKYYLGGPKPFTHGRCPVCGGKGKLLVSRFKDIHVLVNWIDLSTSNSLEFLEGGAVSSSVVRIKADPKYFELLNSCKSIEVDGFTCVLAKPIVLRGLGSRKILIAYFLAEDKYDT